MRNRIFIITLLSFIYLCSSVAQDNHQHIGKDSATVEGSHGHDAMANEDNDTHADHGHAAFDPGATAIHHISDANVYSILDFVRIPLPTILYAHDKGWDVFSSGRFDAGHHEDGHHSYNGYVLHHGSVHRVTDAGFPMEGSVDVEGYTHKQEEIKGKKRDVNYAVYQGKEYRLDARSTMDGGILGGGFTSFIDFSPTKNVISMILVSLFLILMFRKAANAYRKNPTKAPSGIQGFLEPVFLFIRDDVAIPFIGKKHTIYLPFLLSVFFFILGLNLWGQVPFLGSVNVTGSLSVTMVLAVLVFIIVNVNGNKQYWGHIFWMPDVPIPIKILLAFVEVMGLFIKPLTLMLRSLLEE